MSRLCRAAPTNAATSRAIALGVCPPSVSVVSSRATQALRRRFSGLPCTRASAPGRPRAPRASPRPRASGGTGRAPAAERRQSASRAPSRGFHLHLAEPGQPGDAAARGRRRRRLRPDPRGVAAVLVGDHGAVLLHALRHVAGEPMQCRLRAEDLVERAGIHRRDLLLRRVRRAAVTARVARRTPSEPSPAGRGTKPIVSASGSRARNAFASGSSVK